MTLDRAKWIWISEEHGVNTYADFLTEFYVDDINDINLEISVDGNYAVYLNGSFVNSGQYPDYPEYKVYDELAISSFLTKGMNTLLIRVYWPGKDHFSYRKEDPGLVFSVCNGDEVIVASDEHVPAARNCSYQSDGVPQLTGQLGYSFWYDSHLEGTEVFSSAKIVEKSVKLYPRPIHKLHIGDRLSSYPINYGSFQERSDESFGIKMQTAALTHKYMERGTICNGQIPLEYASEEDDGVYLILDLKMEQVGFFDLDIELPEDAVIMVGYGEHLEDLRVRTHVGSRNFAFRYDGKKGRNQFFMPFRRLGCRYLQLHVYARSFKLYYAGLRPTTYPLREYPLEVHDLLHKKIYEVCVQTLKHCMHDHYEDTPWREQGLYTMDSRNEMLCGYDVFREKDFPKACLRLIALSVREDGLAEICSPARNGRTIPSFSAIYLVQILEYLEYSGDKQFVLEILPYAEKIAESFVSRISENGLIGALQESQYWNYYEWQTGLDGKADQSRDTYDAPLCAFVSMGFQAMEKIYRILGDGTSADRYSSLWKRMNLAAHNAFWNGNCYNSYMCKENGKIYHEAQLTQALMICCGACPKEFLEQVRALLMNDQLLPVTLSYSIFKYDAIMTDPTNRDWVLNDIAEIWGNMLFNGATTFWETADGAVAFRNAGSLCHGWSAIPLHIYHKYGAM